MNATEVTVQLPREEAEFLEVYAKEHATSVAEIVTRYARRLQSAARRAPHPENVKFTGSVPADVDVREAYRKNIVDKHQ
jgi:predicted LPLAT superfamily acyltransferase